MRPPVIPMSRSLSFSLVWLAAGIFFSGLAIAEALDWPAWRGPDQDGSTQETDWKLTSATGEADQAWRTSVGAGLAGIVTQGPRAYTLGNRPGSDLDTVYAFEAGSGAVIWTHAYACPSVNYTNNISPHGPASTPTLAENRLFTLSREGHLRCLDLGDGRPVWTTHLIADLGGRRPKYGYAGSPLVRQGTVFLDVGGAETSTVALEAATGRVRWRAGGGPAGYATPLWARAGERDLLAVFKGEGLVAYDPATGVEFWRLAWRGSEYCNTASLLTLAEGVVVTGVKRQQSEDGDGTSLVAWPKAGETNAVLAKRWHAKELAAMFTSPVRFGDLVIGFHDTKRPLKTLVALDQRTGGVRWVNEQIDNGGFVLAGDRLLVLTQAGELVVARISSVGAEVVERVQVLGGKSYVAPTLSQGRVFCRNNAGDLVCLRLRR